MLKRFLLLATFSFFIAFAQAQYCGNSGAFQCTASNLSVPGLSPLWDSLPPFVNGQPSSAVIQFKNFNQVYYFGGTYTVVSLKVDSIDNLPAGLCWSTNKADNTFANQENGCIRINGTPCGPTGQYKMRIIASVNIGVFTVHVDANDAGLKYFVRLKNSGDADTPIDSLQTPTNPFIAYGGACGTPPLNAYLGINQTVCSGSVASLDPIIVGGQAPFTYAWQATGNSLSCNNCAKPTATLTQNSTYIVSVTDASNTTVTDTIQYNVTGSNNNFQITASGATSFCEGGNVVLKANNYNTFNYQWLQSNQNVAGATDTAITATSSGDYYLLFTGTGGCYATSNHIAVTALGRPNTTITQQPLKPCQGDTVRLTAVSDSTIQNYQWKFNSNATPNTTAVYNTTTNGTYTVITKNAVDCYDTITQVVSINPLPVVSLSGNADSACSNGGLLTLAGGTPAGGVYSGTGVSNGTLNPNTGGVGPRLIYYTYTDSNSCSKAATELISVVVCTGIEEWEQDAPVILYPNPVTNQLITTCNLFLSKAVVASVYDSNGKLCLLESTTDGARIKFNTQALAPGLYTLLLKDGNKQMTRQFVKTE